MSFRWNNFKFSETSKTHFYEWRSHKAEIWISLEKKPRIYGKILDNEGNVIFISKVGNRPTPKGFSDLKYYLSKKIEKLPYKTIVYGGNYTEEDPKNSIEAMHRLIPRKEAVELLLKGTITANEFSEYYSIEGTRS